MTLSSTLGPHLPYLRRYARALTGSQKSGDSYVRACLEAFLEGRGELAQFIPPRIALYRLFHVFWATTSHEYPTQDAAVSLPDVEQRLQSLQPHNREALLLTTIEGFSNSEAALILDCTESEVAEDVAAALRSIDKDLASRILIIEDEPLIAIDIEELVVGLGHTVVGIASTRSEAVKIAQGTKIDLILSDVQLADGSSGIDAVADILESVDVPVIFVTAFPERLLTGERVEPTYLITKPFLRDALRTTISQALFFNKSMAARAG